MQLSGGLASPTHYSTYYEHGLCYGGCPPHAQCEWAFCWCDEGYSKGWGRDTGKVRLKTTFCYYGMLLSIAGKFREAQR